MMRCQSERWSDRSISSLNVDNQHFLNTEISETLRLYATFVRAVYGGATGG